MSSPRDKGPTPAGANESDMSSAYNHAHAYQAAVTLTDPANLSDLDPEVFIRLYKAVTDFRWNDPQHNLSADDERDPDDLRDLNEDNPERDYPLTLDGNR